jgi:protein-tyrosine phosphatase
MLTGALQPAAAGRKDVGASRPRVPCAGAADPHNGRMVPVPARDTPVGYRICFVCTGATCRSPIAESVFAAIVERAAPRDVVEVTSAGVGDWHLGECADPRAVAALARHGYPPREHRARQFDPDWFDQLDLVVAMDRSQERMLRAWAGSRRNREKVRWLGAFDPEWARIGELIRPVPGDDAAFDVVVERIERAGALLFRHIESELRPHD